MISTASMPPNSNPTASPAQTTQKSIEYVKEKTDSVVLMNDQSHSTPGKVDKWNLMEVSVGFDVTRKGERSLVINGYKFTKSRDGMSDRVFWRCSRRECKATAVTVGERLEHVRILHDHERPPSGEFYASSAAAAATTTTTATAITSHTGSPSNYRARRKSNQQSRGIVKQTAKSASEGSVEKNSSSPPKSRSIILSNITEQKQLISDSETANESKSNSENGFHVMAASNQHQQSHPPQLFPAVNLGQEILMAPKYSAFAEIDNRGLSALADAAASQSKRDSQNSTPDPPFEVPVASPTSSQVNNALPSGATVMGGPFLLLGPRDLTQTTPASASLLVGGNNSSEVPLLPAPSSNFPNCTRRFSVSELPISARSCLPRSSIQTDQYPTLRASNFMGNFYEARVRGGILPSTLATSASSTPGGGGMLLHWKKEKMLESKAEEEAEKEQQQYGRRRYYTASAEGTPSVRTAAVAEVAAPTSLMIPGVPVVADEQPLKRKRCASECHPPVSVAPEFSPTVVVESNNPPPIDPPTIAVVTPPTQDQPYTDWCVQVHNELQTQMYTTIRQLLARVNAADGAENVISLCSAMTACLDTITANKRARQDILPGTVTTSTP